jgi:DNA polymerase II small subunit/DNA polymerase delta subunit B
VLHLTDDTYTECAVLHIGDWHVGKKETDHHHFPERVARIRDRLIELRQRTLASYVIPEMLIAITGDMVDGAGVFPKQAYNQAIPDPREQAMLCGEHLSGMIDALRPYYGNIRVAAVPGNHGSAGKFMPDSSNWDLLVYDILAQQLAGKVPVQYNPADPWILRAHVAGDYHALLYHGHNKLGRTINQMQQDVARWNLIDQFHPFKFVFFGHLHHLFEMEFNGIQLMRTGTALIDDPYSRDMGYASSVKARLFGVNTSKKDREVTWSVRLDLT